MIEILPQLDNGSSLMFYLKLFLAVMLVCKSIQTYQTRPTQFYYCQTNKLMTQFMEESKIRQIVFKPHILLLWHLVQSIVFLLVELFDGKFRAIKTEDDLFKCPDGGTVGIAWAIDDDGTGRPTGK